MSSLRSAGSDAYDATQCLSVWCAPPRCGLILNTTLDVFEVAHPPQARFLPKGVA